MDETARAMHRRSRCRRASRARAAAACEGEAVATPCPCRDHRTRLGGAYAEVVSGAQRAAPSVRRPLTSLPEPLSFAGLDLRPQLAAQSPLRHRHVLKLLELRLHLLRRKHSRQLRELGLDVFQRVSVWIAGADQVR